MFTYGVPRPVWYTGADHGLAIYRYVTIDEQRTLYAVVHQQTEYICGATTTHASLARAYQRALLQLSIPWERIASVDTLLPYEAEIWECALAVQDAWQARRRRQWRKGRT